MLIGSIIQRACSTSADETRGYTEHEDDAEFGLVNMRGWIYDPQVARFLTPDPVVAEPRFGQSYNRYVPLQNGGFGAITHLGMP